jgi:hypothetical protein
LDKKKTWVFGENLRHVKRAGAACAGALHDVKVDHGGGYVGMAEEGGGKTRGSAVVLEDLGTEMPAVGDAPKFEPENGF